MASPNWDEAKHPRVAAGSPPGGRWRSWEAEFKSYDEEGSDGVSEEQDKTIERLSDEAGGEDVPAAWNATMGYASMGEDVNDYLRTGTKYPKAAGVIKDLDSVFSAASLSESIRTFRGVDKWAWSDLTGKLKVGDTFEDKGYVSTSISKGLAAGYSSGGGIMTMLLPKGSKVQPLSGNKGIGEVLINRNSKFEVVAIDAVANTVVAWLKP
jgi:hypothetical protein